VLQAEERRVEGALFNQQRPVRDLLDPQEHAVPVERAERHRLENQEVQRSRKQLGARRHPFS
jgi:hypothetical protein